MPRSKTRPTPRAPIKAAAVLGGVGLLPLFAGAVAAFVQGGAPVVEAARLYALVVLGFLGGTHWGLNIRHQRPALLTLSILPVLGGWLLWLALDPVAEAVALAIAFAATHLLDEYQTDAGLLHGNYRLLRRILTGVAVVCLVCMANAN